MDSRLTIREIDARTFDRVWPIFHEVVSSGDTYAFDPATTLAEARAVWTTPPTRAFVAELDGDAVGTYMLRPSQPGLGNHVANAGYMVAREARGRGIARAMCEHSMAEARAAGFRAMQYSFVVSTNTTAVALWQRCGFAVVGRIPGAFRHPRLGLVDVLIMHRELEHEPGA